MGNLLNTFKRIIKEVKITIFGLDAAGKTTILYQMKYGEDRKPIHTIGFNVEELIHKKLKMTIHDLNGQDLMREKVWKFYYENRDAIIFVVDSNDKERLEDAT